MSMSVVILVILIAALALTANMSEGESSPNKQLSELGEAWVELGLARTALDEAEQRLRKTQAEVSDFDPQDFFSCFGGTAEEFLADLREAEQASQAALQLARANFEKAQEKELDATLALERRWDETPAEAKSADGEGWLSCAQLPRLYHHPRVEQFAYYPGRGDDRPIQWTRVERTIPTREKQWDAAAEETKSSVDGVWYTSTAVPGLRYCPAQYLFVDGNCEWTSILQRMRMRGSS